MKTIIAFCLIGLSALSCKTHNDVTPAADTCKLAQFVNYSGTNDFTYDAAGDLSKWVISSNKLITTYAFTRDAAGRITTLRQNYIYEGKILDRKPVTRFTYVNGVLTNTNVFDDTTKAAVINRTFTFDANRRLTKRVSTYVPEGMVATDTYEYDARGNTTRHVYSDTDGFKSERSFTYDDSKNPEQLLIKSIPFNFYTGLPWSVNVAVTEKGSFDDGTGPVTSSSKRTNIKTNAKGYVISATETYNGGQADDTYSLTDCP